MGGRGRRREEEKKKKEKEQFVVGKIGGGKSWVGWGYKGRRIFSELRNLSHWWNKRRQFIIFLIGGQRKLIFSLYLFIMAYFFSTSSLLLFHFLLFPPPSPFISFIYDSEGLWCSSFCPGICFLSTFFFVVFSSTVFIRLPFFFNHFCLFFLQKNKKNREKCQIQLKNFPKNLQYLRDHIVNVFCDDKANIFFFLILSCLPASFSLDYLNCSVLVSFACTNYWMHNFADFQRVILHFKINQVGVWPNFCFFYLF